MRGGTAKYGAIAAEIGDMKSKVLTVPTFALPKLRRRLQYTTSHALHEARCNGAHPGPAYVFLPGSRSNIAG